MNNCKYLVIPFLTLIISQILKCIVETTKNKKIDIIRLLDGSGGMPSTHSATVSSITTIIGLNFGFTSPYFAACLFFSLVVMYDAMGIRYETGKQAEVINQLVEKVKLYALKKEFKKLKEQVGHKPIEVLCGMLLGIFLGIVLNTIII